MTRAGVASLAGWHGVLLALAFLLQACAVDPLHARRAAATAAAAQDRALVCAQADACAVASPYRDLAQRAQAESSDAAPVHYVNLVERGADSLLLRLHLIRSAQHSIDLQTFIFARDDAGYLILDELIRAAQRGVTVRVLMDAIGARDGLATLGPQLRAAGVEVVAVMPLRLWGHNAARFDLRNHRKIAVIDGAIAYFGSQNIVVSDANRGLTNEELAVRTTGPIVRHLDAVLLADRFLETDTLPREVDLGTPWPDASGGGGLAQVLPSGPGYSEGTAEAVMVALMYGASARIVLTAPYVVPSAAFLAAMCTAARRGVAVTLVVDKSSNKPIVQLAQASYYDEMLAAGVRVLQHTGSFLHAKHLSVDDDTVLIGSSNLDIRSFALNAEISVLIRDRSVAAKLAEIQVRDLANAEPVTIEARAALSRFRRALENLARLTDAVL